VQVFRRLYFMKVMWSVPTDEYWNEVHLDVAGHRYRPYLETLTLPARDTAESFRQFAEQIDLTDIELTESAMNRSLWNVQQPRAKAAWRIASAHEDETAETALSLAQANEKNKVQIARDLLKVSPYHAYARATLIEKDWENVQDQVAAWGKESGDPPAVL